MSFVNAVKSGFRNYATFKGRASRAEYWWWTLFTIIVNTAVSSLDTSLDNFVSAAILLPTIAVAVRRMHDTDHRGWWMLFPIVNLVFSLRQGTPTENRFGPPPPPASLA